MKRVLSFPALFLFFLFCGATFAQEPLVVQTALALKKQVEEANANDIRYLHNLAKEGYQRLSPEEKKAFLKSLSERLKDDRKVLKEIRRNVLESKQGTPDLNTSLGKLIGTESPEGATLITGILQDAQTLLEASESTIIFNQELESLSLKKNEITVAKTLLIYSIVLLKSQENLSQLANEKLESNVQMLYRASFPAALEADLLKRPLLACQTSEGKFDLLVPNAGYIFGGNFVKDSCRGIDCSAFVSKCVQSPVRMSTMYLDMLAREIQDGEKAFTEKELVIREEMIRDYQLLEMKALFKNIDPSKDKIEPGDLVTWRGISTPGGHIVIYLSPKEGNEEEFVAIEANRADGKSKEGIEINTFSLNKENMRTTVLRRVYR